MKGMGVRNTSTLVEALHLDQFRCAANAVQVLANASVNLPVRARLSAVIGPNGGGKSTLVKLFTGHLHGSGLSFDGAAFVELRVDGENCLRPVTRVIQPRTFAGWNIEYVAQEPAWPPYAEAADVFVAGSRRPWPAPVCAAEEYGILKRVAEEHDLCFPEFNGGVLSRGDLQRVLLSRALQRLKHGGLLVLDEATASLPIEESMRFLTRLQGRIGRQEMSVLLVTHRAQELAIADQVIEVRQGRVFHKAPGGAAPVSDRVRGATATRFDPAASFRIVVRDGLRISLAPGSVTRLSLESAAEEVELFVALMTESEADLEALVIDGQELAGASFGARRDAGLRIVPGDRTRFGVFDNLTVEENIAIGPAARGGVVVNLPAARVRAEAVGITAAMQKAPAWCMSGGFKQRAIVARELDPAARLLVAFNLTQGIDVATTPVIEQVVADLVGRGGAALLIGSD